ncbi:uncharacterized protein LOC143463458 [Clavelina lepadiformis]|uniref:RING finger protein nhl-1 n=1 Tax=Clavelina lepadiformis TaxID=159417 RepID=A0ABP0GLI2_CLALP
MESHLEQLITCPVCLDRFKVPKILPCQHTFCLKPCLQNLVVDKKIRCPQCRSTHFLPRQGLVGLPNNLTIISILDLPSSNIVRKKDEVCQECQQENSKPEKCSHCERKLCRDCSTAHFQHLVHSLARSLNQVRKHIPKVSEMITELEERQVKSVSTANSLKSEVNQAIERCVNELKNRQNILLDHVDLFVGAQTRQLRVEQDTLEMELATLSSHCEAADKKCQFFSDASKGNRSENAAEVVRLMQQSQEHLRNIKSISSGIDDSIQRAIKFHKDGENALLSNASAFGEIAYSAPSRLSLSLGSDPVLNDMEIDRAFAVEHGRRADQVSSYIPSFTTPLFDTPTLAVSPAPSPDNNSLYGSSGSTTNSPRNQTNAFVPGLSNGNPQRRRRLVRQRRVDDGSERISSFLSPENDPSTRTSLPNSPLLNSTTNDPRWLYRAKGPVKRWFGSKGSDVGCLNWPRGVAVTPNDNIVVADSSNHRVHIFHTEGEPTLTFGGYGSDEGQFDCLAGVHVTAQGWILTADRYNHRIQIFDSMGRFIRMFGQEGSGEGELSYPWGVATDNMGFIYVCDKDNHRIQVFTLDGQFIRKFGRIGTHDGQLDSPQYLAVTHDNKVLVSDSGNHRIQAFDKYGRFLFKFGREGSAEGQLKYPRGVVVDYRGNIVVGDSGNNRIQIYRHDGTYLSGFSSWGPAPGQVKGIEGVALLGNNDIVISDRENHRIQVF